MNGIITASDRASGRGFPYDPGAVEVCLVDLTPLQAKGDAALCSRDHRASLGAPSHESFCDGDRLRAEVVASQKAATSTSDSTNISDLPGPARCAVEFMSLRWLSHHRNYTQ